MKRVLCILMLAALGACSPPAPVPPEEYAHLIPMKDDGNVWGTGRKWGYMNTKGEFLILPRFDSAERFEHDLGLVRLDGKWGWLDRTGEFAIPATFDHAERFYEGLARVRRGGKWGFVDELGREAVPLRYDNARPFTDGRAAVEFDGKWGFIDRSGRFVIHPQFGGAEDSGSREGLASVMVGGLWGAIDRSGKMVVPPLSEWPCRFRGDVIEVSFRVEIGGDDKDAPLAIRRTSIYHRSRGLLDGEYDVIRHFCEGMAAVKVCEGYTVQPQYGGVTDINPLWGFINTQGELVIEPQFEEAEDFDNGHALVVKDGVRGIIDEQGRILSAEETVKLIKSAKAKR